MKNHSAQFTGGILLCCELLLLSLVGCTRSRDHKQFYYEDDFKSVAKTDVHVHINGNEAAFMKQVLSDNFKVLTINTDCPEFAPIRQQQNIAAALVEKYPQSVMYAGTFRIYSYQDENWGIKAIDQIDSALARHASAIKIWKNIGMTDRDATGKIVMPDDLRMDTIYSYLEQKQIPLFIHVGEPKNCWLPVEQMTVSNDKIYFKNHPEYHMLLHPEMPGYNEYIKARDNILRKHRNLRVIGCHLGSLEWSVDELASRLDEFPNFSVDISARMGHLQFQSISDREKVRNFFIKYQDRLLYGSDINASATDNPDEFSKSLHASWLSDWKFLCTADQMTSEYVDKPFYGLQLPKSVIDKIYNLNAARYFTYAN